MRKLLVLSLLLTACNQSVVLPQGGSAIHPTEMKPATATATPTNTPAQASPTRIPTSTPDVTPLPTQVFEFAPGVPSASIQPTPPDLDAIGTGGWLWWINDPTGTPVGVTSDVHQTIVGGVTDEFQQRLASGEACLAQPGSPWVLRPTPNTPLFAVGIEVISGNCAGFRGWVMPAALHDTKPPVRGDQDI